jgi:hypothetical protein
MKRSAAKSKIEEILNRDKRLLHQKKQREEGNSPPLQFNSGLMV